MIPAVVAGLSPRNFAALNQVAAAPALWLMEASLASGGKGNLGAMMRSLARLIALLVAVVSCAAESLAQVVGKPENWQMNLGKPASPMMQGISDFHTFL